MLASVTVRAPAKVNLALGVGPLRADGYHGLATVFHAVSLYDDLVATPLPTGSGLQLVVEGEGAGQVPLDATNLAARAVAALEPYGASSDVSLTIRKGIPVAGGMAGGSADAAAALVATDALFDLGLGKDRLLDDRGDARQRRPVRPARRYGDRLGPRHEPDDRARARDLPLGVRPRRGRTLHPARLPRVRPAARGRHADGRPDRARRPHGGAARR